MSRGQDRRELREAKGCEDGHDIRVMREIEVQCLVQWECRRVIVERNIDLSRWLRDQVVLQTSNELLDVANTDSTTGG